jgi:glycosyltransferase involved in cell wall biosynthesis
MNCKRLSYSIVLCTYNNCNMLEETLLSLSEIATGDLDVVLILVNNNSTDATQKIIDDAKKKMPFLVMDIFEKRSGLAIARNTGVSNSNSDIIIFTDDDVLFEKNFLVQINRTFSVSNCAAVGSKIILKYPTEKLNWLTSRVDYMYGSLDLGNKDREFPTGTTPLGPCMAVRSEIFDKYGYFNEELGLKGNHETLLRGEETELMNRFIKGGEAVYYSADAIVYHVMKKERLTKAWFLERFEHSGKLENKNQKVFLFNWWKSLLKLMIANLLVVLGALVGNEGVTFYARCKSLYFFNIVKRL